MEIRIAVELNRFAFERDAGNYSKVVDFGFVIRFCPQPRLHRAAGHCALSSERGLRQIIEMIKSATLCPVIRASLALRRALPRNPCVRSGLRLGVSMNCVCAADELGLSCRNRLAAPDIARRGVATVRILPAQRRPYRRPYRAADRRSLQLNSSEGKDRPQPPEWRSLTSGAGVLHWPIGHALQEFGDCEVFLRPGDPVADGDPGRVHRCRIARDEWVPPVEVVALGQETVGAGVGQPREAAHGLGRQAHAIGNLGLAVRVVAAAAGLVVKEGAAHIGVHHLGRILVLELDKAAAPAAVAQALPLVEVHGFERLQAPEGLFLRLRAGSGCGIWHVGALTSL